MRPSTRQRDELSGPARGPRPRPTAVRPEPFPHAGLLVLQRTAGNAAVTALLQRAAPPSSLIVQRTLACPPRLAGSDPVPSGFKPYYGNSCWFHCCYRGILEDRKPTPDDPQQECFYDDRGGLVDDRHDDAGCRGTPNDYDSASSWWNHTFRDRGGIWAHGWGAFWSSRWHDLNQHFEHEGERMLECSEVCSRQPWYMRGFCYEGCDPSPVP